MKLIDRIHKIVAYDELALFQISFSYVLVLILNPSVVGEIFKLSFNGFGEFLLFLALGAPFFMGIFYSIVHIFIPNKKTSRELWLMIISATVINFAVSYYGLKYGPDETDYKIMFPILNVIQTGLTLWFLGVMSKDDEIIYFFYIPGNVKITDAIINIIIILVLILFFHFYLETLWYYTIASALSWTILVSKFIRFIPK